jgi:predicted ATPase
VTTPHNPYAAALDGLEIDDPVAAFFDFCRARERVRVLRESGAPAPWSDDPIFQRGRFLNVFREDDRGSRAILRFATPLTDDLPRLIHALFFARWCNSQRTLDALSAEQLAHPTDLREALQSLAEPPWCNETAYPVEAITWEGETCSRFDTATTLFGTITPFLVDAICGADGNVVRATERVNARLGMHNDFPIFMAVMDLAWFRPEVIHPFSPVPTGIGAVAFLDRLQAHLGLGSHTETCDRMMALQAVHWPEARRPLQPIDIEYLSCECRKYYSYVNGTKAFEGKNLFRPASSITPYFDIPSMPTSDGTVQTQICVIAGGPCSGKTSVLEALAEAGYRAQEETAERLIKEGVAQGRSAEDLRADPVQWQRDIYRQDHALFDSLPVDELVFTDTSMIESMVFGERAGFSTGPKLDAWLRHTRYAKVFFLDPLTDYEQTAVRIESQQAAVEISAAVKDRYRRHGYELIAVPSAPVAQRVQFILARITPNDTTEQAT